MKIKNIKKNTRKIILVETILIFGILGYLFFSTSPSQLYPLNGMVIIDKDFNLEIENAKEIIISSDTEFVNPIFLEEGDKVTLPPGLYYWKVKGLFRESDILNFTIQGHVALTLKGTNETYELRNIGNVNLNVTQNKEKLIKEMLLESGELKEVEKDNSTYIGEQI